MSELKKYKLLLRLPVMVAILNLPSLLYSQIFDSLTLKLGTQVNAASDKYQPLWLIANNFGTVVDRQTDLTTFIKISNKIAFVNTVDSSKDGDLRRRPLFFIYGFSLYNNSHFKNTFFEQGFFGFEYKKWKLRFGRFEEITGDIDHDLSSGSLGISGNALPIPQINLAVTDYIDFPFTNGWLQVKGSFAHGWFGNDRYMKDAFYHGKTFYVRIGPGKLKFYAGLQHFGEWGGDRGHTHLDRSINGFWNVVLVKAANDGSVNSHYLPSRAGDQRGLLEAGFYFEKKSGSLHGYAQMPFESGEEIDPRNRSFLVGLVWSRKNNKHIKKLLLEILYTKDMNNFVGIGQRQSYYNNGFYKTGWDYEEKIIGTPLFMDRERISKYFPNIPPLNWDGPNNTVPGNGNIVNNRVFAIHGGASIQLSSDILLKSIFTFTRNYGSLSTLSKELFFVYKTQYYTLQDLHFQLPDSKWTWRIQIGLDFGELGSNIGGALGFTYSLLHG